MHHPAQSCPVSSHKTRSPPSFSRFPTPITDSPSHASHSPRLASVAVALRAFARPTSDLFVLAIPCLFHGLTQGHKDGSEFRPIAGLVDSHLFVALFLCFCSRPMIHCPRLPLIPLSHLWRSSSSSTYVCYCPNPTSTSDPLSMSLFTYMCFHHLSDSNHYIIIIIHSTV